MLLSYGIAMWLAVLHVPYYSFCHVVDECGLCTSEKSKTDVVYFKHFPGQSFEHVILRKWIFTVVDFAVCENA